MKKVFCIAVIVALSTGAAFAVAEVSWSKDDRLIQGWFADNANTAKFIAWSKENLTQDQIDALETLMFPQAKEGDKQVALELMKLQMQQLNLEKDPAYTALYESVSTALTESREAKTEPAPAEAEASK